MDSVSHMNSSPPPPPPPPPPPIAAYMRQGIGSTLVQKWLVAYLLPNHYLDQCWRIVSSTPVNIFQWNSNRNLNIFIQKCIWKCCLENGDHFVSASMCYLTEARWRINASVHKVITSLFGSKPMLESKLTNCRCRLKMTPILSGFNVSTHLSLGAAYMCHWTG